MTTWGEYHTRVVCPLQVLACKFWPPGENSVHSSDHDPRPLVPEKIADPPARAKLVKERLMVHPFSDPSHSPRMKTTVRLIPFPLFVVALLAHQAAAAPVAPSKPSGANLALVAATSTSFVSAHEKLDAINDGATPRNSGDKSHGAYGNWPKQGTQWVQYEWSQAISLSTTEVYWFSDGGGIRLPKACRLKYWDGSQFADIPGAKGLGVERNRFNLTEFPELKTSKLRLEIDADGNYSTGISEWRAYDSGNSPNFAPAVEAGIDRTVVLPGATYLDGSVKDDGKPRQDIALQWSKLSGPGDVTF